MPLSTFITPKLITVALLALSLAACAGVPKETSTEPTPRQKAKAPEDYPAREFPAETLYELLLAEFAGIRNQVEASLEIYTIQAQETRDPNVIARAIHIASFMRRTDVILDLAELWVEVEPDNIEVRRLLAFHLARSGRVVEAFPHGQFLLLSGDDDYLQSLAAFAQDSPLEEKERLLTLYEELELEYPENPGLLLGKAMLLRQLERLEDSLQATNTLISIDKANETAQLLHAQLLHSLGEKRKAYKSLEKALRILPDSKRLRLQYARFLSDTDLSKSREQIKILSEKYPDDANILFSLGLANKELGLLSDAQNTFEKLVKTNRRKSDAHYQLGLLAESSGHPEEAVYQYRQVKEGQNLLQAAMRVAEILAEHNNLSAAREHLSTMRAIYPALRENLFQIEAELLMRQDRLNEAFELLSSALQTDPESINLRYARSIISAEQKDLDTAEKDLRAIIEQDQNNATALNALGYTMAILSTRYDEALDLVERAASLEPDNPAIIDSMGWIYFLKGQHDKAIGYLQAAFDAFPDGEVAAHLGEALWINGQHNEAESVWRKGLENSPDNAVLLDTIQRLAPDKKQVWIDSTDKASPLQ